MDSNTGILVPPPTLSTECKSERFILHTFRASSTVYKTKLLKSLIGV